MQQAHFAARPLLAIDVAAVARAGLRVVDREIARVVAQRDLERDAVDADRGEDRRGRVAGAVPRQPPWQAGDGVVAAFPRHLHHQHYEREAGNTSIAVARILDDGERIRTQVFGQLLSHYLFRDRFARVGKGNDKGNVEGLVKYTQRTILTPIPEAADWEALNLQVRARCLLRRDERVRGSTGTIGERMAADVAAFLPLPTAPFDCCRLVPGRVSSQSLVRFEANDYSVPVAFGHRQVLIKAYVHTVAICHGAEVIARHGRTYERDTMTFDPLHYLPLIEQKVGSLDQAAPLAGWDLPVEFATLRRLLESRLAKAGAREYVGVLRLHSGFSATQVHDAVCAALRLGAISYDGVKHCLLAALEGRPPRLDLADYPHLPLPEVAITDPMAYNDLLLAAAESP